MAFEPPTNYNSTIMVNQNYEIVSPTVEELTAANPILTYNSNLAQTAAETATSAATSATSSAQTAQQAAAQATEISDPEGWRTDTRTLIAGLAQTKYSTPILYCNGGFAKVPQAAFTTLSKATMLVRFARNGATLTSEESLCNLVDGGTTQTGLSVRLTATKNLYVFCNFKFPDGTNLNSRVSEFNIAEYLDGKLHSLAVCWSGTRTRVFIDGALKGQSSISTASGLAILSSTCGISVGARSLTASTYPLYFRGQVSDFAVLNYDASEVDSNGNYTSAYSIADYQNGRAIPPSMRPFSEVLGRNATWSAMDNAPVDVSVSGDVITLTTTAEISDAYFRIKPAGTINGRSGQTFRASIDSTSGFGGEGLGVKPMKGTTEIDQFNLTNDTKSGSIYLESAFDSFNLTIRYGSSPIPSGTVFTITGFRAWVNGAVVALENYTIARNATTRLVKDTSGNGNDATVSGILAGDRDNGIAAFVDELKTQINQQA